MTHRARRTGACQNACLCTKARSWRHFVFTYSKTWSNTALPRFFFELLDHTNLRAMRWQIDQKLSKRNFSRKLKPPMPKVADVALWDAIQIGFVFAGNGFKAALFNFVKQNLTAMARNSSLNVISGRKIEFWTKSIIVYERIFQMCVS